MVLCAYQGESELSHLARVAAANLEGVQGIGDGGHEWDGESIKRDLLSESHKTNEFEIFALFFGKTSGPESPGVVTVFPRKKVFPLTTSDTYTYFHCTDTPKIKVCFDLRIPFTTLRSARAETGFIAYIKATCFTVVLATLLLLAFPLCPY